MGSPSPFEVARAIGNNLAPLTTNISDRAAIDEILSKSYSKADPETMQRDIASILKRVSPEKQAAILGAVKSKYEEEKKNKTLNERKKIAKEYGLPESIVHMPEAVFTDALKSRLAKPVPTFEEYTSATPTERAKLAQSNPKVYSSYEKELNPKQSKYMEVRQRKAGEKAGKLEEIVEDSEGLTSTLNEMKRLEKDFSGVTGLIGAGLGTNKSAVMFDQIALKPLEHMLHIVNPRGSIPLGKIVLLQQRYLPKSTQISSVIQGRIKGLEFLSNQTKETAQKKIELYDKYDGIVPPSELQKFEKTEAKKAEAIIDKLLEEVGVKQQNQENLPKQAFDQPPPAADYPGQIMKDKTGKRIISDGKTWKEVS